jgi:hypothetical protein
MSFYMCQMTLTLKPGSSSVTFTVLFTSEADLAYSPIPYLRCTGTDLCELLKL